eukprot:TRINITY_DN3069_c0_g1_i1.p1 TRINITY_DN3069_c0_g1~~TRINITY_DN3069_c0_g1_i1.p1  ORF type:complete len:403 (+),score=101.84 TRINITY_DN3069_c0_g1_i1:21-1229(+)
MADYDGHMTTKHSTARNEVTAYQKELRRWLEESEDACWRVLTERHKRAGEMAQVALLTARVKERDNELESLGESLALQQLLAQQKTDKLRLCEKRLRERDVETEALRANLLSQQRLSETTAQEQQCMECIDLRKQLDTNRAKEAAYLEETDSLKERLSLQQQLADEAQNLAAEQSEKTRNYENQLRERREDVATLTAELHDAGLRLERSETKVRDLEKEVEYTKKETAAVDTVNLKLQGRVGALEQQHEDDVMDIEAKRAVMLALTQAHQDDVAEKEALRGEGSMMERRVEQMRKIMAEAKQCAAMDVAELSESLRTTREELHNTREALADAREENQKNINCSTQYITSLTDELNSAVRTAIEYETQFQKQQQQQQQPLLARRTPAPGTGNLYSPQRSPYSM